MIETQAHRYSSKSIQRDLSNEYQFDRIAMVFKGLLRCALAKVTSALEGLTIHN